MSTAQKTGTIWLRTIDGRDHVIAELPANVGDGFTVGIEFGSMVQRAYEKGRADQQELIEANTHEALKAAKKGIRRARAEFSAIALAEGRM